ncbi:hypothetical protein [Halobacillus naozhouensis]|uniref:Uncharacterized protein n=2 Tax=Halobacillus naozhouensis TaxID=554880 RepID=A0ABY8IZV6_9BACI|nr:hypothetical protein [Halobacillus naozhouensis]WFT75768.1 hypothetical protein P9989_05130 [Halobacillus naozhouensis]
MKKERMTSMYPIYYFIAIVVSLIALVGTLYVARDMIKKEKEDSSSEEELASLKKEGKSSSITTLTTIYTITFIIAIVLIWIFIF